MEVDEGGVGRGARVARVVAVVAFTAVIALAGSRGLQPVRGVPPSPWLPSGVLVGVVLVAGVRSLPWVVLAAWLAELSAGRSVGVSVALGLVDTAEAVTLTCALRAAGFSGRALRMRESLMLVAAACFGTVPFAALWTAIAVTLGLVDGQLEGTVVRWTWAGHAVGVLVCAPAVLALWEGLPRDQRTARSLALFLATVVVAWLVVDREPSPTVVWLPYLIFPLLAVSSLEHGHRAAAASVVVVALITTWETAKGRGPFAIGPGIHRAMALDLFQATAAATSLVLSAFVLEREQRERLLAAILENTPSAVSIRDRAGRFVLVNERLERLVGRPRAEIVGRTSTEILPPDVAGLVREDDAAVVRVGRAYERELAIGEPDAPDRYVALMFPIRDDRGAVGLVGTLLIDVTARRRAEAALAEREALFRTLAEGIPQLTWMSSPEGRTLWFNDRWRETLGWTPDDLSRDRWKVRVHPDHLERVGTGLGSALARGEPWGDTLPVRAEDGGWRWLLVRVTPFRDDEGRVVRWLGTATDVTAQKTAEIDARVERERLGLALDAASLGTWERDLRTGEMTWSSHLAEMWGFPADVGSLPSEAYLLRTVPEDRPVLQRMLGPVSSVDDTYDLEFRIERQDGTVRWLHALGRLLQDEHGQPLRQVGVVMDVTDRKRAQEELERTVARLQEEHALRDRFVAMLSHDLRNPLSAASLSAQILLRGCPEPPVAAAATRIQASLARAERMVGDLLDVYRVHARSPLPVKREHFDLVELARVTLEELRAAHGDRFVLESKGPVDVDLDPRALRRVLENLLVNAVKYGDPAAPIRVRVRAEGDEVELAVHNEGEPIPDDTRATLFELFGRGLPDASGQGWGIGLAVVRGVVEAHGGRVAVESETARGTTFTVRLPRAVPVVA